MTVTVSDATPRAKHGFDFTKLVLYGFALALCLLLGVYPQPVINASRPDLGLVARLVGRRPATQTAQERTQPVDANLAARPAEGKDQPR